MQYFSVYDLLMDRTKDLGKTMDTMVAFFRAHKIRKSEIVALQQTTTLPCDSNFKEAILDYLDMSELEVALSLGHIPAEYRKSYFGEIKKIALLLNKEEKDRPSALTPFFENENEKFM